MTLRAEDVHAAVEAAEARIRPWIRETILEPSPRLSAETGAEVWLKLENLQHTGSFKFRGAMSRLTAMTDEERRAGVVAASTGNHGLAVARASRLLDVPGTIFLPASAAPAKVRALEEAGAALEFHGADCDETEVIARAHAEETGTVYVSPYNDAEVLAGQGTLAIEAVRQTGGFDAACVAVGGGGLISGIAGWLAGAAPDVEVVGCIPANSPVMLESVEAGEIAPYRSLPTLSDGTAGGMEAGAITFPLCRDLVDSWRPVEEDEILAAMRLVLEAHHMVIEGAAGVAVAALLGEPERYAGRRVVVVICGGNVGIDTVRKVVG